MDKLEALKLVTKAHMEYLKTVKSIFEMDESELSDETESEPVCEPVKDEPIQVDTPEEEPPEEPQSEPEEDMDMDTDILNHIGSKKSYPLEDLKKGECTKWLLDKYGTDPVGERMAQMLKEEVLKLVKVNGKVHVKRVDDPHKE